VTLTAIPDSGSGFVGWEGACTGIGNCVVNMTGDSTVTAIFQVPTFIDVPANHPFFGYIETVYDRGITTGYQDGTYRPSDKVTRAAMAAFIIRSVYGEDFIYPETPYFTDVLPSTNQFFKYIQEMREENITTGCTATEYCPSSNVSRQAMAAFIIRALEGEPPSDYCESGSAFTDVPTTSQFCKYIKRFSELGITTGCTATEYCPFNNVTRAAMAAFLSRAFLEMP
jgi:hypothetical protein